MQTTESRSKNARVDREHQSESSRRYASPESASNVLEAKRKRDIECGPFSEGPLSPLRSRKKRCLSEVRQDDSDDSDVVRPSATSSQRLMVRKLAFHPDVVDNSLWADLNVAKRPGEFHGLHRQLPTLCTPKIDRSESTSSADLSPPEDSPENDKENTPPPDDFKDRPIFTMLSMRGNLDSNSEDRDASMSLCADKAGFIPQHHQESSRNLPNVVTTHRRPSPESPSRAHTWFAGEAPLEKGTTTLEAMKRRLEKAQRLPFPGFVKPPNYDSLLREAKAQVNEEPDFDPFARPPLLGKPLDAQDIAEYSHALMKRIGNDREAKDAFVKLMAWRGQLGYDAGYSNGIREQVTQLVQQAMLSKSRESPP